MKVLLHDEHKGTYYAGSNKWVMESKLGLDFGSIEQALRTKEEERLSGTDVIVVTENCTIRLTASGPQSVSKLSGPS